MHRLHHESERLRRILQEVRGYDLPWQDVPERNKRLNSKKDKETLKRFKRDTFDESIPVSQTIGKYFNTVKDINTKYNLAY
ncbi:MAG: hypothetical protein ACKPKO_04635, partial [Candidatus Fonsibacter sp.]